MAATCPHGFPPSECLICPTLPRPGAAAAVEMAARPAPAGGIPARRRQATTTVHLVGVAGAIVVLGLAAWALAGVVFGLLHVLELVAVGAAAGWAGYRLGHFRGSRSRRGSGDP